MYTVYSFLRNISSFFLLEEFRRKFSLLLVNPKDDFSMATFCNKLFPPFSSIIYSGGKIAYLILTQKMISVWQLSATNSLL